jgi:predicted transcriptional regulator
MGTTVSIYIAKDALSRLEQLAQAEHRSRSNMAEVLIIEGLEQRGVTAPAPAHDEHVELGEHIAEG